MIPTLLDRWLGEVEEEVIDEKGFINTVWKPLPTAITMSAIKISACQTGDKLL